MINKDGMRIDLHSKDDIPYLIPGEGSEPHKEQLATDIHNLLNQKVLVADVPAVAGEDGDGDDGADKVNRWRRCGGCCWRGRRRRNDRG